MRARGHEIRFVAPANFETWIRDQGFPFWAGMRDFQAFFDPKSLWKLQSTIAADLPRTVEALQEAAVGADLLVGASLQVVGSSVAELLGVPYVSVVFFPGFLRVPGKPPGGITWERPPDWINRLLWRASDAFWNVPYRRALNRERQKLGLAPVQDVHRAVFHTGHILIAADPVLGPAPRIAEPATICGPLLLDEPEPLAESVEAFLQAGPPPVFLGFGSMTRQDAPRVTRLLASAARAAGQRAILHAGWAGLTGFPPGDDLLAIAQAPFGRLFPRVATVVHHGGAGTVAQAARAGVPQVVVPHFADQPIWGARVHALGLGPRPIPDKRLTVDRLARAIAQAVSDPSIKATAAFHGQRMATVDGVVQAADALERHIPLIR